MWRHYYEGTDGALPQLTGIAFEAYFDCFQKGLIYVVDSNDRDRVEEARKEFQGLLGEADMNNAVVLVFANKQDLPQALSVAEVTDKMAVRRIFPRSLSLFALFSHAPPLDS